MAQRTRQKKPEHISTIEELHDFLHVTSPRVWVFLVFVAIAIVGSIAYASTVTIENATHTTAQVVVTEDKNNEREQYIYLSIPNEVEDIVDVGMVATIGTNSGRILNVTYSPDTGPSAYVELDDSSVMLSSGTYDATIVLGVTTPLSYLLN